MGLFDGIASSAVGGITNLVGGILSNNMQTAQAAEANRFSAEQSSVNRDWQEQMRATQYQTAVKDLQAAGLNPMLAYTQGGAGNLSGSSAVGQQATIHNPTSGLASSAAQMANIKADLELKDAQTTESFSRTGVNDEQRKNLDADTMLKILEAPNVSQRLKNMAEELLLIQARKTATSAEEAATRLTTKIRGAGDLPEAQSKGRYYESAPYNPYALRDISQAGSSASSVLNSLKPYNFKFGK